MSSFILKTLWVILHTKARLCLILPRSYPSHNCQLCGQDNARVPETPDSPQNLPPRCRANPPDNSRPWSRSHHRAPYDLVSRITILLNLQQRDKNRVSLARTRAEIEARCRILRDGKISGPQSLHQQRPYQQ